MELLPRKKIFPLIIFFCYYFCLSRGQDCGGSNVANTIIVDQQGKGAFQTIQAAINSINSNNYQWIKIHINPGIYQEMVHIPTEKPCVILEGSGRNNTIITSGYHKISETWSATFTSSSPHVIVSDITFKNSYNLGEVSKMSSNLEENIQPALAAAFYGDKSAIFRCGFLGYQDTLFAALGRHYFKDCYIQGEIDFIFGYGQSYFEDCTMNATLMESGYPGFVTAQSRDSPNDPSGFVFKGGFVVGNGQVNLGRPWGPYSRVIFLGTYFSNLVTPQGWDAGHYSLPDQLSKFNYAEVNCTGPGANNTMRVGWIKKDLSSSELNQYSLSSFIDTDQWLENIPSLFL